MSDLAHIFEGLNPEQREAVAHVEGPLLVLAGAGSGKTRTLTHRIAHLIGSGAARPWEILAVTFTNKAAREMRERVERLLGESGRGTWVATFHSTCVRILRREIGELGYESNFAIYDQADSLALVRRVLRGMNANEKAYPPRAVRAQLDRLKNRGVMPQDLAAEDTLEARRMGEIYLRYQKELRRANALDFGDLILLTVRLFETRPQVLERYQQRWRYVLVDEYQDTNPIQYRLLKALVGRHQNLCVVGDEDQSIYAFREADIRNILDFEKDYPGARTVRLEQNYRSTQPILDAASSVVSHNTERKGKTLFTDQTGGELLHYHQAADDRAEAAWVIDRIMKLRQQGDSLADMAIFYRTHAQSRPLEEELLKYNTPYVVIGGTRFYDRAEVKDALAYLRALHNPADTESLLRIINTPTRGIGRATLERMLAAAEERDVTLWQVVEGAGEDGLLARAPARRVAAFAELMRGLRADADGDELAELLALILERTGYLRTLEAEGTVEAEARLENLKELLAAAEEFQRANAELEADPEPEGEPRTLIDLFLEQVTLLSEADQVDTEAARIPLMTVHVAKGLEFKNVFVVGMEEGIFPHFASLDEPSAVEEERRICYVAMTRAERRLHLSSATMRRMHGSVRYNAPSRFLDEIPSKLAQGLAFRDQAPGGARGDAYPAWASKPEPSRAAPRSPGRSTDGPTIDYSDSQVEPGELPIRKGSQVEHGIFGRGEIIEVQGSGAEAKIRVRFARAGVKMIKVKYAQLRLLS